MESGYTKTFEEVKEQWKKDFNELRDDIETLTKNINEFEEQVNKAKKFRGFRLFERLFWYGKGIKTYFDFLNQTVKMTGLTFSA